MQEMIDRLVLRGRRQTTRFHPCCSRSREQSEQAASRQRLAGHRASACLGFQGGLHYPLGWAPTGLKYQISMIFQSWSECWRPRLDNVSCTKISTMRSQACWLVASYQIKWQEMTLQANADVRRIVTWCTQQPLISHLVNMAHISQIQRAYKNDNPKLPIIPCIAGDDSKVWSSNHQHQKLTWSTKAREVIFATKSH